MKFISLITLSLCALALGENSPDVISPPGIAEVKGLENSQYDFKFIAPNFEESQDLVLSEAQLQAVSDRFISNAILDLLENFRTLVINGNDNIPPLDPLVVSSLGPIEFRPALGVVATGNVNSLQVDGLRWFVADRISVNALRLTFGLTLIVPSITITGSYDAHARVLLLSHTAAGNFRVFAHRIEVSVDMRMGTNIFGGGHLVLRELDIHLDIHDTNISITGMTGSTLINNFISSTIQSVTSDLIQNQLDGVGRLLSEELFEFINDFLKDYTIADLIP